MKYFMILVLCLALFTIAVGCDSAPESDPPVLPITQIEANQQHEEATQANTASEDKNILDEYITIIYTVDHPDTLQAMILSGYWGSFSNEMPDSLTVTITNQYFPGLTAVSIADATPAADSSTTTVPFVGVL